VAKANTRQNQNQSPSQNRAPRTSVRQLQGLKAAERIPELDGLIHERMRLGIVSALAAADSLTFNELKDLLKTTDGNVSVHARRLEEADYVQCTKSFDGRIPRTEYRLTPLGREALQRYLDHMEALVRAARARP
jgi:DNA-binding MarR family transcriptional regulator